MGRARPGPAEQEKGGVVTHLAADFKELGMSGPWLKEQFAKKATVEATFIFRTVAVRGSFTQHALF